MRRHDLPRTRPGKAAPGVALTLLASFACTEAPLAPEGVEPLFSHNTHAIPPGPPSYLANADFYHLPQGACQETEADVTVSETGGPHSEATVELHYSVLGVCGPNNGLFYYELTTQGPVLVDSPDAMIHRGLLSATLDADVLVFDEEGGYFGTVHLIVEWERERGHDGNVEAMLSISAPFLNELFVTNPLATEDAEIRRVKNGAG